jgi:hypothetical protein
VRSSLISLSAQYDTRIETAFIDTALGGGYIPATGKRGDECPPVLKASDYGNRITQCLDHR